MIYDPFQQQAIDFIDQGHSVIVSAPTGAGKTAIAEYVINNCLKRGEKVIYTAPIKALSNQKFRDFREDFGDKIGILTGDVGINPTAEVLIMTTEIFRNQVLEGKSALRSYRWIIFDEIHFLDDYERGTVWEESLIFLPEGMKILALSATIPNVEEIARWLESIRPDPIKIVQENQRPVPLHLFYQCRGQVVDRIKGLRKTGFRHDRYRHYRGKVRPPAEDRPRELIKHLFQEDRLPCIYFSFGRRRCERLAESVNNFNFLTPAEQGEIRLLYKRLCEEFGLTGEASAELIRPLIERGVAYHHAGMLPTLKEVVERVFTSRLIKVIFTTETFALGINMPARSVIFDKLRKYYGSSIRILKRRDFNQMAGRAGRRGIDREGYVFCRVDTRFLNPDQLKRITSGTPEMVRSRFNASYATVLHLYRQYGEGLYDIYPLSFHFFQEKEHGRRKALARFRGKVEILKQLGLIRNERLTAKGEFAGQIYGYELLLAEYFSRGLLPSLSVQELGILALALVFEPKKGSRPPRLSGKVKSMAFQSEKLAGFIRDKEERSTGRAVTKKCFFHLTASLQAWMANQSFDRILTYTDVDEGELIRYFRMSIQILRSIIDTPAPLEVKDRARKTILLINRDIIDAERQLRR